MSILSDKEFAEQILSMSGSGIQMELASRLLYAVESKLELHKEVLNSELERIAELVDLEFQTTRGISKITKYIRSHKQE